MTITAAAAASLVVVRAEGYGDVFPLTAGHRHMMGRANTNRIVLKDDLCSREHAEIFQMDGRWYLRDLNSLNGTRINGEALAGDRELQPKDEVYLGRSHLVFVEHLNQLPSVPTNPPTADGRIAIKKRLRQTRFLAPMPPDKTPGGPASESPFHSVGEDLSLLYRLALQMGAAAT